MFEKEAQFIRLMRIYTLLITYSIKRLVVFFLIIFSSCSDNYLKYGKIDTYSAPSGKIFVFYVSEEFVKLDSKLPKKEDSSGITKAELELLKNLLKRQKYCVGNNSEPSFLITSRQEKIYDATYAHLIEQNYKSRPVSPRMYFGKCKNF